MKKYFKQTLKFHESHLLFQSHSHHCWPDIAYSAMNDYQTLVQTKLDDKWIDIFSDIIPRSQKVVADLLSWPYAESISFGTNTQELLIRLFSALTKSSASLRVLSTEFEYHSARRLLQSLHSAENIQLDAINTTWENILVELTLQLSLAPYDVCLLSQSFFLSGYTLEEKSLLALARKYPKTLFIIDCYHSFAARELNYQTELKNVCLLGGGYKYAMSGEGCCFLAFHPEINLHEPLYNGWMAEYAALNKEATSILEAPSHTSGYHRLLGATFDPVGFYRLVAVWENFKNKNITPEKIKKYVTELQKEFLLVLDEQYKSSILLFNPINQGNFLTFVFKNQNAAQQAVNILKEKGIFVDSRSQFLRFGFGPYVDKIEVVKLAQQLNAVKEVLLSMLGQLV